MSKSLYIVCGFLIGCAAPCAGMAAPSPQSAIDAAAPAPPKPLDAAPKLDAVDPSAPTPMTIDDLSGVSAGAGAENDVVSRQQLTAVNSGNSVNAATVTTGTISLEGSALSGYNGVGNFVMNTGNNNNLQGSLSVNISGVAGK